MIHVIQRHVHLDPPEQGHPPSRGMTDRIHRTIKTNTELDEALVPRAISIAPDGMWTATMVSLSQDMATAVRLSHCRREAFELCEPHSLDPSCCYLERRKGYNNRPTTYLCEDIIQGKPTRPD